MTARLNNTSLMRMNCAERTAAKAAAAAHQTELHLLERCYAPQLVIARVPGTHIRQIINCVHLLHRQRINRRILYNILLLSLLHDHLAVEGILLLALQLEGTRKLLAVSSNLCPAWQLYILLSLRQRIRYIGSAADIMQILSTRTTGEIVGNLDNLLFPHAVYEDVCSAAF